MVCKTRIVVVSVPPKGIVNSILNLLQWPGSDIRHIELGVPNFERKSQMINKDSTKNEILSILSRSTSLCVIFKGVFRHKQKPNINKLGVENML